jgi:hypothetical protein
MQRMVALALATGIGGCWILAGTPDFRDGEDGPGGSSSNSSATVASSSAGGGVSMGGSAGNDSGPVGAGGTGGASGGSGGAADKVVFLSQGYVPDQQFDSQDKASLLCNTEAAFPATYVAWLSGGNINAIDQLPNDGQWYLPGGELVFPSRVSIITDGPLVPIDQDAAGVVQTAGPLSVWTGTANDGTATALTCDDWTNPSAGATVGAWGSNTALWTNNGNLSAGCSSARRLYCFQQ